MPPKRGSATIKNKKKKEPESEPESEGSSEEEVPPTKKTKSAENESAGGDIKAEDLTSDAKTKDGKPWTFKLVSINANGFRAFMKKGGANYIKAENADMYCIQETKCKVEEVPKKEIEAAGYSHYFLSGDKAGYSGVGIIYKKMPVNITQGIGVEKHDTEGRVITAEYSDYYVVNAYVPNSGRGLPRLDYRTKEWDVDFRKYITDLDKKKPVILCGDMNVAHEEIDLKNPKPNRNKIAGFCDGERTGLSELLSAGFIDTFRQLNPKQENAYTFWTFMGNARAKNVGWRLDYFIISKHLESNLCDSLMRTKVMGSDHCPICLLMAF